MIQNGNKTILWWLLGFFSVTFLTVSGFWLSSLQGVQHELITSNLKQAEKMAIIETTIPYIKEKLDKIDQRLERIEQKK